MADPEMQETLSALCAILEDISADMQGVAQADLIDAVINHHSRALESLQPFCERFGILPEDLLTVLSG